MRLAALPMCREATSGGGGRQAIRGRGVCAEIAPGMSEGVSWHQVGTMTKWQGDPAARCDLADGIHRPLFAGYVASRPGRAGLLTNGPSAPKLNRGSWGCAIETARATFLCLEMLSLQRWDKRSFSVGLLAASGAAAVHLVCCAGVLVACCCCCDVSSVHLQEMSEPGATGHARLDCPDVLNGASVASSEHGCRRCDKRTQTALVALRKLLLKAPIPLRILGRPVPPRSDQLGASPVLYAQSLPGQSGATLQMVRVTALRI